MTTWLSCVSKGFSLLSSALGAFLERFEQENGSISAIDSCHDNRSQEPQPDTDVQSREPETDETTPCTARDEHVPIPDTDVQSREPEETTPCTTCDEHVPIPDTKAPRPCMNEKDVESSVVVSKSRLSTQHCFGVPSISTFLPIERSEGQTEKRKRNHRNQRHEHHASTIKTTRDHNTNYCCLDSLERQDQNFNNCCCLNILEIKNNYCCLDALEKQDPNCNYCRLDILEIKSDYCCIDALERQDPNCNNCCLKALEIKTNYCCLDALERQDPNCNHCCLDILGIKNSCYCLDALGRQYNTNNNCCSDVQQRRDPYNNNRPLDVLPSKDLNNNYSSVDACRDQSQTNRLIPKQTQPTDVNTASDSTCTSKARHREDNTIPGEEQANHGAIKALQSHNTIKPRQKKPRPRRYKKERSLLKTVTIGCLVRKAQETGTYCCNRRCFLTRPRIYA